MTTRGRRSGPRIRTLKPEVWQDERFAGVSRDATLLYVGLVTQADDAGRQSANPALIRARIFPLCDVAADEIAAWLDELSAAGLVQLYAAEGRAYVAIASWADDQRIEKPTESTLPAPPAAGSPASDPGLVTESSGIPREESANNPEGSAKAPAGPDQDQDQDQDREPTRASARAASDEKDEWPERLVAELQPVAQYVVDRLGALVERRGGNTPTRRRVGDVVADFPEHDHRAVVGDVFDYWVYGKGSRTQKKDWVRVYRDRCKHVTAPRDPLVNGRAGATDAAELRRKILGGAGFDEQRRQRELREAEDAARWEAEHGEAAA